MSNDQSPPARKVIPYKKGGQRKSPFADLAFQFSGTALDVAIQQREEGADDARPENSEIFSPEPPAGATASVDDPPPAVETPQSVAAPTPEPPTPPAAAPRLEPSPSPPAAGPPARQRRAPAREVRLVTDKQSGPATPAAADARLQAFITRWRPFLTETQLGICTYVYNNSAGSGQEYCFTSTAKLMAAVSKTERQVKTVLNRLIDWGFLIKGETVVNAPRERRGTYYKLAVNKS